MSQMLSGSAAMKAVTRSSGETVMNARLSRDLREYVPRFCRHVPLTLDSRRLPRRSERVANRSAAVRLRPFGRQDFGQEGTGRRPAQTRAREPADPLSRL